MKESLINKKRPDLVAEYKYGADVEAFSHLKRASYRKGRKGTGDDMPIPPHLALPPVVNVTDDQCPEPPLIWLDIGIGFRIPAFAPTPSLPRTDQSANLLIRTCAHMPLNLKNDGQQAANVLPELTWLSFPPLACLSFLRRPVCPSTAVPPCSTASPTNLLRNRRSDRCCFLYSGASARARNNKGRTAVVSGRPTTSLTQRSRRALCYFCQSLYRAGLDNRHSRANCTFLWPYPDRGDSSPDQFRGDKGRLSQLNMQPTAGLALTS
ncbi:hypothetical protein RvY_18797-2 [Ramazzottius varieornatus]|uniref:Uncharacterized protein n=1 Tax=Ramazzottius varieornatus TaxID=947166 RepID=A0A1D1W8H9_RAMVA|nr:hypothetical protein RvY_18797-2 [Ramazzottius varieornatus]